MRIPSGDSSQFFGNYVGQKFGPYDSNTCWDYSLTETVETQLELERSLGRFTQEDLDWFKANGYIDEDGDFYLSRRWIAILSGVKDNGNDQAIGWQLAAKFGMIPFPMLPYSPAEVADKKTRSDFVNDYFNPDDITPEMESLGKEFLKRVKIQSEELGTRWTQRTPEVIQDALKQGSLPIGVPVPNDGTWNQVYVTWNKSKTVQHSVELYNYVPNDPFPYKIYDSYEPHLKQLSADYYIPIITRGIVTAADQALSPSLKTSVFKQFVQLLIKLGIAITKWS